MIIVLDFIRYILYTLGPHLDLVDIVYTSMK